MFPKLFPILLLFNLFPLYLSSKKFLGFDLFKKRSPDILPFEDTSPTQEQFKKLVGEIAHVFWKEGKCANGKIFHEDNNPFLTTSKKIALQLGWILETNCLNYENYPGITNLIESMLANKKTKPIPKRKDDKWKFYLKFIKEKFDCDWCDLDFEKAIEIAAEIREEALEKIFEKCFGSDIFKTENDNHHQAIIQIELNKLKKLNCATNFKLKWLRMDNAAELFSNLPRREGEDHKLIPIRNKTLLEKLPKWKEENSHFKEIVKNLVHKIFSTVPHHEIKDFFLNKACTIENGHNLNLDELFSSKYTKGIIKEINSEWFRQKTNKCVYKNGRRMEIYNYVPIEDEEMGIKIKNLLEEMYEKEYSNFYIKLVEELAKAHLVNREGICEKLSPFEWENKDRINVKMNRLIDLFKLNWRSPEYYRLVDTIIKLKQFEDINYSNSDLSNEILIQIDGYFNRKRERIKLSSSSEIYKMFRGICHECWRAFLNGTVKCFLNIAECRNNANSSNPPFKFNQKIPTKIVTSMEMLLKQNEQCWRNIHETLFDRKFEEFSNIFSQIMRMEYIGGRGIPTIENVNKFKEYMREIDEYLNFGREEFELSKEFTEIAAKYFQMNANNLDLKKACELLGLQNEITLDESKVKAAYRKAVLKYHPDKNSSERATEEFQELQAAYNMLLEEIEKNGQKNV